MNALGRIEGRTEKEIERADGIEGRTKRNRLTEVGRTGGRTKGNGN